MAKWINPENPQQAGRSEAEDEALILTRRQMMARGAAASATVAGLGALQFAPNAVAANGGNAGSAGSALYPGPIKPVPPPPVSIFSDETLTFQTLFALGNISAASGEYGEITTVIKRIQDRDESYVAFYEEFLAEAQSVAKYAAHAAQRGRP